MWYDHIENVFAAIITGLTGLAGVLFMFRKKNIELRKEGAVVDREVEEAEEDLREKRERQTVKKENSIIARYRGMLDESERRHKEEMAERKKAHEEDVNRLEEKMAEQATEMTELAEMERDCRVIAARQEEKIGNLQETQKQNTEHIVDLKAELKELKQLLMVKGIVPGSGTHQIG